MYFVALIYQQDKEFFKDLKGYDAEKCTQFVKDVVKPMLETYQTLEEFRKTHKDKTLNENFESLLTMSNDILAKANEVLKQVLLI